MSYFIHSQTIKRNSILIAFIFLINTILFAQNFKDTGPTIMFLDGKKFYNSELNMNVQYGAISIFNTYGITVENKNGVKYYFINCQIDCYDEFADIYGINPNDGSDFGFRVYSNKLIVGKGEEEKIIFYLK
jgi:hypothetical protein